MNPSDYQIGIDMGTGKDIAIRETFMRPTLVYPDGSYLREVDGKVEIATGFYATLYPDKPSPYWHGQAPFIIMDTVDWQWRK